MAEKKEKYGVIGARSGSVRYGAFRFVPGVVVPIPEDLPAPPGVQVFDDKKAAAKFAAEAVAVAPPAKKR